MFVKQSVWLQEVPLIRRCHSCHQLRLAISSQVLIHKPSGRSYCRWLCEDCGKVRGLRPTPEYLKNLLGKDEEGPVEADLKILVRV